MTVILLAESWAARRHDCLGKLYHSLDASMRSIMGSHRIRLSIMDGVWVISSPHNPIRRNIMPRLADNNMTLMISQTPIDTYRCAVGTLYDEPNDHNRHIVEDYIAYCDGELFDGFWRLGDTNGDKTGYVLVAAFDESLGWSRTPRTNLKKFISKQFTSEQFKPLSLSRIDRSFLNLVDTSPSYCGGIKYHYLPLGENKRCQTSSMVKS